MRKGEAKTVIVSLLLLGGGITVVAIGAHEFLSHGTTGVGGISIANYQAEAQVQRSPAPDFTMPALQGGGSISLSSLRGHVVVLNLWASWCAPCRLEAAGLEETFKTYAGQGVRFLGVDIEDNNASGRSFVSEFHITYPSVVDPAGRVNFLYRILGLPTTFIIDANGQILYRFLGYLPANILRPSLDNVLSGKP